MLLRQGKSTQNVDSCVLVIDLQDADQSLQAIIEAAEIAIHPLLGRGLRIVNEIIRDPFVKKPSHIS